MSKNTQCAKKEGVSKKKKRSLGRQCSAYQCYSTFYTTDGSPTGLHFFRFPQKNPEKLRWCNLIKRVDGIDGFKVTRGTVLCEKHFTAADIKRNPNYWRLVSGAVPSQNLYQSSVTKTKRKARKPPSSRYSKMPSMSRDPGMSSKGNESIDDCDSLLDCPVQEVTNPESISVATQTDFSFITSPICLLPNTLDESNDLIRPFIENDDLQSKVKNLNSKILTLNRELEEMEVQIVHLKASLFLLKS